MKITFIVAAPDLSGGDRVVAIYANLLQQLGHQVTIVSSLGTPLPWRHRLRQMLREQVLGGQLWRRQILPGLPAKPRRSHLDDIDVPHHALAEYRAVAERDVPDADVIIATWWETAEWIENFSAKKGEKVYFIQHHEVFDYLPIDRVKATYRLPFAKITISQWLVDLMGADYGDDQVTLVPNSVDFDQFYAPKRGRQTRPTVGMLYSPIPWKGCATSFKAFEQVAQQMPNAQLVTFGQFLPTAELPLPPRAEFMHQPAQATIKDIYARCDVWLCGSLVEGFCLPALEAMACRCPVVSTPVGGLIDLVESGVNGYLAPIEDATALADRLLQILSLPEPEWQTMSDAAYAIATRYSWQDAAKKFEAALYRACERPRGAFPATLGQPVGARH